MWARSTVRRYRFGPYGTSEPGLRTRSIRTRLQQAGDSRRPLRVGTARIGRSSRTREQSDHEPERPARLQFLAPTDEHADPATAGLVLDVCQQSALAHPGLALEDDDRRSMSHNVVQRAAEDVHFVAPAEQPHRCFTLSIGSE